MSKSNGTRSTNMIFLIGHPCKTIAIIVLQGLKIYYTGHILYRTPLPSARLLIYNITFHHNSHKLTIEFMNMICKTGHVFLQLVLPFWNKSRLAIRKNHIILKIRDVYGEKVKMLKNKKRNNLADQVNKNNQYLEKLD